MEMAGSENSKAVLREQSCFIEIHYNQSELNQKIAAVLEAKAALEKTLMDLDVISSDYVSVVTKVI